jgi:hypothetical protein
MRAPICPEPEIKFLGPATQSAVPFFAVPQSFKGTFDRLVEVAPRSLLRSEEGAKSNFSWFLLGGATCRTFGQRFLAPSGQSVEKLQVGMASAEPLAVSGTPAATLRATS